MTCAWLCDGSVELRVRPRRRSHCPITYTLMTRLLFLATPTCLVQRTRELCLASSERPSWASEIIVPRGISVPLSWPGNDIPTYSNTALSHIITVVRCYGLCISILRYLPPKSGSFQLTRFGLSHTNIHSRIRAIKVALHCNMHVLSRGLA